MVNAARSDDSALEIDVNDRHRNEDETRSDETRRHVRRREGEIDETNCEEDIYLDVESLRQRTDERVLWCFRELHELCK